MIQSQLICISFGENKSQYKTMIAAQNHDRPKLILKIEKSLIVAGYSKYYTGFALYSVNQIQVLFKSFNGCMYMYDGHRPSS